MSKLVWDQVGQKTYETGVEKGVLYPFSDVAPTAPYPTGVAWNGLINVTEKPSGAEPTALYADNIKYLELTSKEEFGASIEAYTYPEEFGECIGEKEIAPGVYAGQQDRKMFGLTYRTLIGNDTKGDSYGYKLHLVYNAKAAVAEKAYGTVNESPEAMTLSWELSTTPVEIPGGKPSAILTLDSTKVNNDKLAALENILYGSEETDARLPLPTEIATLMGGEAAG